MPEIYKNDGYTKSKPVRGITCDQVAWLLQIADRYIPRDPTVGIDQRRDMLKYGMLYEIIEILGLDFADDTARNNATPGQVRRNYG